MSLLTTRDTDDLAHYLYDYGHGEVCQRVHGLTDDPDEWIVLLAEEIGWRPIEDAAEQVSQRVALAVEALWVRGPRRVSQ
jgi:hypothetical protein